MTDLLAIAVGHLVALARYAATLQLDADETVLGAVGLSILKDLATGEVLLAIDQLRRPAEPGGVGIGGVIDVVAIEAESHLQTEGVTSTEADRLDVKLLPCLEELIPEVLRILDVLDVELVTTGAGVAGIGYQHLLAVELSFVEAVVRDRVNVDVDELLDRLLGLGPLDSEDAHPLRAVL